MTPDAEQPIRADERERCARVAEALLLEEDHGERMAARITSAIREECEADYRCSTAPGRGPCRVHAIRQGQPEGAKVTTNERGTFLGPQENYQILPRIDLSLVVKQLNDDLAATRAELERAMRVIGAARQVNDHWNEFGAEAGVEEFFDCLHTALQGQLGAENETHIATETFLQTTCGLALYAGMLEEERYEQHAAWLKAESERDALRAQYEGGQRALTKALSELTEVRAEAEALRVERDEALKVLHDTGSDVQFESLAASAHVVAGDIKAACSGRDFWKATAEQAEQAHSVVLEQVATLRAELERVRAAALEEAARVADEWGLLDPTRQPREKDVQGARRANLIAKAIRAALSPQPSAPEAPKRVVVITGDGGLSAHINAAPEAPSLSEPSTVEGGDKLATNSGRWADRKSNPEYATAPEAERAKVAEEDARPRLTDEDVKRVAEEGIEFRRALERKLAKRGPKGER